MKISNQIALAGWGAWFLFGTFANAYAPSTPEEYLKDPEGITSTFMFLSNISNIGLIIGVIATVAYIIQCTNDPVEMEDEAKIFGDTLEVKANRFQEITKALKLIEEFINSESVPDETQKKYGSLLVENIREENTHTPINTRKIYHYLDELSKIIDSSLGSRDNVRQAVKTISLLE